MGRFGVCDISSWQAPDWSYSPSQFGLVEVRGWRAAVTLVAAAGAVVFVIVFALMRDRPSDVGLRPYGQTANTPLPSHPPLRPLPALAHASMDRERIASDLRKLAMLALPFGVKIAYVAQSWGTAIRGFADALDVVERADMPNLGVGIDSFQSLAARMVWSRDEAKDGSVVRPWS